MSGEEGLEDATSDGYLPPKLRDSDEGKVKAMLEHSRTDSTPVTHAACPRILARVS